MSTTFDCHQCGNSVEVKVATRVPTGWKRHDGIWCAKCWKAKWKLCAITLPIVGPAADEPGWPELREALATCWQASTRISNWAMTQLYARDVRRQPGQEKMPAMAKCYLYPEARKIEPDMDSQSASSLLQAVEKKYRKKRYAIVWTASESLPNHRYPVPYPCHNTSWKVSKDDGGNRILSVRLAGRRWALRLRGGQRHRRMLGAVDKLISGQCVPGELSLYRRTANGNHRTGDGPKTEVMAKMVMWMPKTEEQVEANRTLHVRTAGESLWTYHVDDQPPRYLHADQVKSWIAAHLRKLERISDDTKHEKRKPKHAMRGINQQRQQWCQKHARRMDSFTHEATAMLANFAARQRCDTVLYDDGDKSFAELFPWHELKEKLAYKLDGMGIAFVLSVDQNKEASTDVIAQIPDPLEQETNQ